MYKHWFGRISLYLIYALEKEIEMFVFALGSAFMHVFYFFFADAKDKDKNVCHCEPCQAKNRRLHASKPKERFIQKVL